MNVKETISFWKALYFLFFHLLIMTVIDIQSREEKLDIPEALAYIFYFFYDFYMFSQWISSKKQEE